MAVICVFRGVFYQDVSRCDTSESEPSVRHVSRPWPRGVCFNQIAKCVCVCACSFGTPFCWPNSRRRECECALSYCRWFSCTLVKNDSNSTKSKPNQILEEIHSNFELISPRCWLCLVYFNKRVLFTKFDVRFLLTFGTAVWANTWRTKGHRKVFFFEGLLCFCFVFSFRGRVWFAFFALFTLRYRIKLGDSALYYIWSMFLPGNERKSSKLRSTFCFFFHSFP